MVLGMKDDAKILHEVISKTIKTVQKNKNMKYLELCYGSDIPTSTFDDIIRANRMSTFFNIAKVVKALGLSFAEFGAMLDELLPDDFLESDD